MDGGVEQGAPDLIVEIAASSASYDLHGKKDVDERHGVQEYIVWRTLDQKIGRPISTWNSHDLSLSKPQISGAETFRDEPEIAMPPHNVCPTAATRHGCRTPRSGLPASHRSHPLTWPG